MVRLNLRANRLPALPPTKSGERSPKWANTDRNGFSAIAASRTLLACERLLRVGEVAPRIAGKGPELSCRASQTSLSPMLWVTWACGA